MPKPIIGAKGTPMQPLSKSIHDQEALNEIHKGVGKKIQQQGGNIVFCVFSDPECFRAFKHINPQASRFMHPLNHAETLRKHPRAEIMCLGAFWAHPNWDSIYRCIREKTAIAQHVSIHFFPM